MSGLRQSWLVARRELRERSRSRAFIASVVIMIVAVVGSIALPSLIDTSGGTKDIGLTGSTPSALPATIEAQANNLGTEIRIHGYDTVADGEQAVRNGTIDLLVVDGRQLEWLRRADQQLKATVTGAIQIVAVKDRATVAGINASDLAVLLAPVTVSNVELGHLAGRSPDDETAAFIMTVLLFMAIATYGAMVLGGVVEEKSSRVVEVLLARIPARNLLAGKVAGIGLLGLAQISVTALAALIAASTVGSLDLPAVRGAVLVWAVIWFVLGYALYATVFGALGSLASRPEDAQSAAGPVSVVLVLVYFVSFAAIGSAGTTWARLVAWFPATAPIAMPTRIAMGAASWWDPLLALVLTAATIAGLVVFGGRVYAGAVLHNGPTLKLREVWHHTASAHSPLAATRQSNDGAADTTASTRAATTLSAH
ncbi:MAG TPA: ABC transporter permease, partial [Ilumatobacteraceae bacterium]|nr:ABC transporter permease [Ilumatobacteraceae bacterium]